MQRAVIPSRPPLPPATPSLPWSRHGSKGYVAGGLLKDWRVMAGSLTVTHLGSKFAQIADAALARQIEQTQHRVVERWLAS
jgi:hypothetical protein